MTPITLHRRDASKNMARYYRLQMQTDLFGQWCFICEWGRIGCHGQLRSIPYATSVEAAMALARQRQAKERRGYVAIAKY